MNMTAVISRASSCEKLPFSSPLVYPVFSILDPETTYSLSVSQTVNGVVDALAHVTEQYITSGSGTPLQDRLCESIISTLIEEAPKILSDPNDYEARANIMWCATNALNGWCSCGSVQDWATHMIGHELTAFYRLDHAQSLAVVMPELWRIKIRAKEKKLAQFARQVFNVKEKSDSRAARMAIEKIEDLFHSLGMKTKLSDYGIKNDEAARKVYERFMGRGDVAFGEDGDINAAKAREILLNC
jgi:NADP-dependent alcohol dehydrogenase